MSSGAAAASDRDGQRQEAKPLILGLGFPSQVTEHVTTLGTEGPRAPARADSGGPACLAKEVRAPARAIPSCTEHAPGELGDELPPALYRAVLRAKSDLLS